MRWLTRLWPSSLSARIACIVVAGLLLAQLLTSTIWFESRQRQMLEIPTRVFATRVADAARILDAQPEAEREGLIGRLQAPGFALRYAGALPVTPPVSRDMARTAGLLAQVVRLHAARPIEVRILDVCLLDDDGRRADSWAMMSAREPTAEFAVAVRAGSDQRWLIAEGREDENGADLDRTGTIIDYVLRIYLLRILIVAGLTLWAVRLAMAPLKRMARAAEELGRDIHSPPLETCGPREVRRASEAFNAMQERIIANIEERTRFLAAVSHDLRSPITRMRLRTELLPQEDMKKGFRRDLTEMEDMVDATLSFVKSGAHEQVSEDVDLDAMLATMIADLAGQGARVTLAGHIGEPIACFPQTLRRAVQNLIDNALRYAGNADLFVSADDATVRIAIVDDGPGIAADQLEAVFEPFRRLEESRNAASGGFGLGLSIALNIAQAHGGSISLHNRPSGGLEASLLIAKR